MIVDSLVDRFAASIDGSSDEEIERMALALELLDDPDADVTTDEQAEALAAALMPAVYEHADAYNCLCALTAVAMCRPRFT